MKNAQRICIILLLLLALLATGFWYFFIHSSALPASLYASYANFQDRCGRDVAAARYYSKAFKLEPNNIDYAISASKAYREDGNYTKAEYVLVDAIGHNSDELDLYLQLSETYVAQDKLLDAERLISASSNETVREQLIALRPAAPVIQPEGGYSADLTTCEISAEDGTAYCSLTREYPSLDDGACNAPVALDYGVTVVSAIAVGQNGLVSPLTTAEFTVCGAIEEVTFENEAFDTFMRELFEKGRHDTFMSTELWETQELTIASEAVPLDDLSKFIRLETLTLEGNYDFSKLSALPMLKNLTLSGCTLSESDLESIGGLTMLESLTVSNCGLTSLNSISGLSALTHLDISENSISDISVLSNLTALQKINLSNNPITDLSALVSNEALTDLNVSGCQIQKLAALKDKTTLISLNLSDNKVSTLVALQGCTALTTLDISGNQVKNLSPIANLTGLQTLNAANNKLKNLPQFSADSQIMTLDLSGNRLTNADALAGLSKLSYLNVNANNLTDLSALAVLSSLYEIDAHENPLANVDSLEASNIIINYDPDFAKQQEEAAKAVSEETSSEETTDASVETETAGA